ncbi:DNA repair protein RadC [Sphingomonas sp. KR1UV-12]|uniref:DNA repair protein RadC n=1 Tax=Sphingomonas aurea TaxID=3063994 RepID=A0ABT9EFM6_9SPHN|nr:DNA repair protein RadC [Sphingomonas sp. KR1UV-12]MDP1025765.1 DNA repair protein RadC [Sphingomonas sp. KR1UV-12]
MADSDPSDTAGHRERLRGRLLADPAGLLEHELVEYLLMLAIPRVDTKPMAKRLLKEFGGLGGLCAADAESLMRVDGVGKSAAAAIRIVQATATRLLQSAVAERPVLANWQALLDYLRADMAHHGIERFRVLHLNTRNVLIRDEVMSKGTLDEAAVHVREVIRRAIELQSAALILVHNHPSGDPSPSRADIEVTRSIMEAGKRMGIAVHDHLIIGASGHVSMRAQGLI